MANSENPNPEERIEPAWRAWLDQPMRRPPEAGWISSVQRDQARKRRLLWLPLAATAAVAAVLVFAIFVRNRQESPAAIVRATNERLTLGQQEVLIWLDEKTPLYMTFHAPE
jgi:ferric-dicitrate binding protein FerR (iron transport regulator)